MTGFDNTEVWFERADISLLQTIHKEEKKLKRARKRFPKGAKEILDHQHRIQELYLELANLAWRAAGQGGKIKNT